MKTMRDEYFPGLVFLQRLDGTVKCMCAIYSSRLENHDFCYKISWNFLPQIRSNWIRREQWKDRSEWVLHSALPQGSGRARAAFVPITGDSSTVLFSPPELRKTSKASWSDMSRRSICSNVSTFTSIEDILPMGSAIRNKGEWII